VPLLLRHFWPRREEEDGRQRRLAPIGGAVKSERPETAVKRRLLSELVRPTSGATEMLASTGRSEEG